MGLAECGVSWELSRTDIVDFGSCTLQIYPVGKVKNKDSLKRWCVEEEDPKTGVSKVHLNHL